MRGVKGEEWGSVMRVWVRGVKGEGLMCSSADSWTGLFAWYTSR